MPLHTTQASLPALPSFRTSHAPNNTKTARCTQCRQWDLALVGLMREVAEQGDVRSIAEALGVPERGRRVAEQMAAVVEDVRRHSLAVRGDAAPPRVALIEWIDPIMGCGHWCGRTAPSCNPSSSTPPVQLPA